MRRPAIDLPDPLDQAPAGAQSALAPVAPTRANADDLLAQLATQEVDRLLAQAGEEAGPQADNVDVAPPQLAPFTGPIQGRRKADKSAAGATTAVPPPDPAIDNLFRQMGVGDAPPRPAAPREAAAVSTADADADTDPDLADGFSDLLDALEKDGQPAGDDEALERTLTARAQQLIDQAQWEAAQDAALPEHTAADRASFAAAQDDPPAGAAPADASPQPQPQPHSPTEAEPASAAAALAAEMEEDARLHAATVARLAAARDSIEAGKNVGPTGLNVTGVSVVGEVEINPDTPAPAATVAAVTETPAAAPSAAREHSAQPDPEPRTDPASEIDPTEDPPEPLLVRFLEWLNAPLDRLSDAARAALGKAAIATTLNALGVLAYVLLFRRG